MDTVDRRIHKAQIDQHCIKKEFVLNNRLLFASPSLYTPSLPGNLFGLSGLPSFSQLKLNNKAVTNLANIVHKHYELAGKFIEQTLLTTVFLY